MTWSGWLVILFAALAGGSLSGAAAAVYVLSKRMPGTGENSHGDSSPPSAAFAEPGEMVDLNRREQALHALLQGEGAEHVSAATGLSRPEIALLRKLNGLNRQVR